MLGDYGKWAEKRDRRKVSREPRNEREAAISLRASLKREAQRELRYARTRRLWER